MGFNNDPVSSIVEPKLTTIDHPAWQMGRIAAEHTITKKENKSIIASQTIELKTKLLIRESSLRKSEHRYSDGKIVPIESS